MKSQKQKKFKTISGPDILQSLREMARNNSLSFDKNGGKGRDQMRKLCLLFAEIRGDKGE